MDKPAIGHKQSRHLAAFVLLFLREEPSHGAALLARMEAEMPHCLADSAGLYRTLQALEREGAVVTSWEAQASGAPRKVYTVTRKGRAALRVFDEDIRDREENLRFFLKRYRAIGED
ncbi:MAG TPA: PadR family transcriptional regulator [Rectinemataceae bacterium]|nr:PadR family transcriptional regulator [Rectinemataceae bacterium]